MEVKKGDNPREIINVRDDAVSFVI